jgi:hypothetical protein
VVLQDACEPQLVFQRTNYDTNERSGLNSSNLNFDCQVEVPFRINRPQSQSTSARLRARGKQDIFAAKSIRTLARRTRAVEMFSWVSDVRRNLPPAEPLAGEAIGVGAVGEFADSGLSGGPLVVGQLVEHVAAPLLGQQRRSPGTESSRRWDCRPRGFSETAPTRTSAVTR